MQPCFDLLIEILEQCTVKILSVVDRNASWNTIAINDIVPEELFDYCRAYI
jgi:hypothetical protein